MSNCFSYNGFGLVFAALALGACSEANHLGNPLTLPFRAVVSVAENAAYDHHRAQTKAWITENEAALRAEGFDGPVSAELFSVLPPENIELARRDLIEAAEFPDFPERATVILWVLGA